MWEKFFWFIVIILSILSGLFWSFLINHLSEKNIENKNRNFESKALDLEQNIIEISEKAKKSVVSIVVEKDLKLYKSSPFSFFRQEIWSVRKEVWWWSWFFISKEWFILTNKHVIDEKDADYIIITYDWKEHQAKVFWVWKNDDLAVLKIEDTSYSPLKISQDDLKVWSFALAIWTPFWEFNNSLTLGIVSWKDRKIQDWNEIMEGLIQTDASINPWNSWWPLLNLKWEVLWVNTAIILWWQGVWFAIDLTSKEINYE